MKKILMALLLIILIPAGALCAEKPAQYGFQDIPFGTPRKAVIAALKQKYPSSFVKYEDTFWLEDFKLGDIKVTVFFRFDDNKNFYSFIFSAPSYSAGKFNTTVKSNGAALTEIFKTKYGKPDKCADPKIFQVAPGYVAFLCLWNNKDLNIYTGIETHEFEYAASAYVTSKLMESAMAAREKESQNKKRAQGAKDF